MKGYCDTYVGALNLVGTKEEIILGLEMMTADVMSITKADLDRGSNMASKKKSSSKKPAQKKSGFYPKVKSTKKNGLGTY